MATKINSNALTTKSQSNPDFERFKALAQKIVLVPKSAVQAQEQKNKNIEKKKA
jgi:hypothetical protein